MNLLQIQVMLEEAYNLTFLEAIEMLSKKRKEYEKSEFYKESKIPLLKLYESYVIYTQQKYDWIDRLSEMVEALDSGIVENKIQEIIVKLENNETIKKILKDVNENFNMANLLKNNEELEELINRVKP